MDENANKRTCLYDRHVAQGAQISAFGGFDMPMWYSTIIEEHNAVRNRCGVFDVSHMGEVLVTGKDAERYVQHIFTGDISQKAPGQIEYGMMLYPDGGVVDDLLVYVEARDRYFIVINAANIDKDYQWMKDNSESIYGCGCAEFGKPEWGRYTQKGNKLYAHVYEECMGAVCLPGLAGKIDHMRLLYDGSEIRPTEYWNVKEYPNDAFFFFSNNRTLSFPLPDERDTVVEITLK